MAVKDISYYAPLSLDPPLGQAKWLAITDSSLRDAADSLAAHRSKEMSAHVVDIEDVVNQFGFGFNTPQAIRNFLSYAITNWAGAPPEYVTIFGDATRNPVMKGCSSCGSSWNENALTLVVTDFSFADRWNGMVPSDFTMSLLFGDDLFADVNIGRMPANTPAEADQMVEKVILFETQRIGEQLDWQKNFLFVADNDDSGGFFCDESELTASIIPDNSPTLGMSFTKEYLCLEPPTATNTPPLRTTMFERINGPGTQVLNYRGHGGVRHWAGGPNILDVFDAALFQNVGNPLFILSADCLDGYFILTHVSALGETIHRLDNNRGTAAHWSSSGFGYSYEHSLLHGGFYEGVFNHNYTRIGDAINYAKEQYILADISMGVYYYSEVVSFILLGDPAMNLFPQGPTAIKQPLGAEAGDGAYVDAHGAEVAYTIGLTITILLLIVWRVRTFASKNIKKENRNKIP